MKKILFLTGILFIVAIACNLPAVGNPNPAAPAPNQPPAHNNPSPSVTPTETLPPTATPTSPPTAPIITETAVPSDLPFSIDCSALPATRKEDCDAFIIATRDQAYPLLRAATGVSLSQCYPSIQYIILPTDPGPGAGGYSEGSTITLNKAYSIDLPHRYDVHELLHSISTCAKALDNHVFHGLVLNYVYDHLGVHDPGYFISQNSEDLTTNLDFLLKKVNTASGADFNDACRGILIENLTLVYFERGGNDTVQRLYRSTIPPVKTSNPPGAKISAVWGASANQVEALLETLKNEYKYIMNVPECGY